MKITEFTGNTAYPNSVLMSFTEHVYYF